MRHKKLSRRLSRNSAHRKAMLRNMVTSLFMYDKIETTLAKAKELLPIAEKMISLAKRNNLHSRRQAEAFIRSHLVCKKIFNEVNTLYKEKSSGHFRIIPTRIRIGDAAPMAIIKIISMDANENN